MGAAGAGSGRRALAERMGTALRVCRQHEPGNLVVEEAIADLQPHLARYLEVSRRVVLLKEDDRIYLDERFLGAGQSEGGWVDEVGQVMGQLGIGAAIFSGAWSNDELRRALAAIGTARGSPEVCREQIQSATRDMNEARLDLLGPDEARYLGVEQRREEPLGPAAQADFLYVRMCGLANAMHVAAAAGWSPDQHEGLIRQSLMDVVEGFESRTFEWRILNLPLLPPLPRLASHVVDTAVLSIGMGRLLGLERSDLVDLGYAAFFASLGRAGRADPGSVREVTQDGVLRALQGGARGSAGARRLIVCRELLKPDVDSHPFSLVVGAADAYGRLLHGLLGLEAQTPHAALAAVRASHHPVVVGLLEDVVGRYPPGTFLRLEDGAITAVLDGGARRGHRPRVRTVMTPAGMPDTSGQVRPVEQTEIAEVIDPSVFGIKPWRLVLGADGQPEDDEDHLALPRATPAGSISMRERESMRLFLEGLIKTIRFHRIYPDDHALCTKGIEDAAEAVNTLLGLRDALELRVTRAGTAVGNDLIQVTQPGVSDLASLLVPGGVRRLRLQQGIDRAELRSFVQALAAADEDGQSDDLLRSLWELQLRHLEVIAYDPLSPERVRRPVDPTLEPVAAGIRDLLAAMPPGRRDVQRALERGWQADEEEGVSPESSGAWPEWVPLFLQSEGGAARAVFLEQVDDPGAELRRAGAVALWAESRLSVKPDTIARARAAFVGQALQVGDHALAAELVREASGESGRLDAPTSLRLATSRNLEALVRRLEQTGLDDEAVSGTLELLRSLDDAAVAPTCAFYATLAGKVALREVFATFLLDRIGTCAAELTPLTLSRDEDIMREALILLGQGGAGSPAFELLNEFAADKNRRKRADAAQQILDRVTGAGARRVALKGILEGTSSAERVAHARRLAKVGDASSYTALHDLVKRRDFSSKPAEEVEAILIALADLGKARAAPVLEELAGAKTRGLLGGRNKAAEMVADKAKAALQRLKRARKGKDTVRIQTGACPKCRFMNVPGAARCLQCGSNLDGSPQPPKRKPSSHDTIRMSKDEVMKMRAAAAAPAQPKPTGATAKAATGKHVRSSSGKTQRIPRVASAAQPAAPAARAWLSYPLLPPVPLGDQVVTVGRLASCDLVLVHEAVSRTHCVFRPVGARWVLEDRSSYGTWVNGERALTKEVGPGDVITVGPYDLKLEAEQVKADPNAITRTLRTFASSEAVGGRLERVSLGEVLQQLEFNQKTGTLEVFGDDGVNGILVVYDGRPMFAEMGDLRDDAAVIRMLNLKKGNFSFRAKVQAGEMTMATTLTGLLMEAARVQDEGE